MYSRYILLSALLVIGAETYAKNNKTEVVSLSSSYNNSVENNSVDSSSQDSIFKDETLHEVKVVARKSGTSRLAGAVNGIAVNKDELFKAACCNLGESFTTNPSVDVAYNDATTGARQTPWSFGHLRTDAHRESAEFPWCSHPIRPGLCAGTLDERHSSIQG